MPIRNAIRVPRDICLAIMHEKIPVNPEFFKPLGRGDRIEMFFNELITLVTKMKEAEP